MLYLLIFTFVISFFSTMLVRRYALMHEVMDIPNHRSAHHHPTPRGGGIGFVVAVLLSIPCMQGFGFLTPQGSLAFLFAAVFIATIGFMDDHGHLTIVWRLCAHALAAVLALYWMHGFPTITLFGMVWATGYLSAVFGFFYIIWFINLYNFMDGIDGLASVQAILVCISASILYFICGDQGLMILPLVLASSVLGFLYWNWPPARIFMGDAGSGFLGFTLSVLSLQAAHMYPQLFWSWLILMAIFIVDATYTLLKRAVLKKKIYEAHSTHGYQIASRRYASHRTVDFFVVSVHIFWLFPLALCVALKKIEGVYAMMLAYAPLVIMDIWMGAGVHEKIITTDHVLRKS